MKPSLVLLACLFAACSSVASASVIAQAKSADTHRHSSPHQQLRLTTRPQHYRHIEEDNNDATDDSEQVYFDDCSVEDYYYELIYIASEDTSRWTQKQVIELLNMTHRNVLPNLYASEPTEDSTDTVISALIDLYPGEQDGTVLLPFSNISFPAVPETSTESTWMRGDVWPLGFDLSGDHPAWTDLHVKVPIDINLLLLTKDRLYGYCRDDKTCIKNAETGSAMNDDVFTPPAAVRGQVARALFYNALRYQTELNLTLSDCTPFDNAKFGYLSTLLEWHEAYPVDEDEVNRNTRICNRWQGNRNPFVDMPELVGVMFGQPDVWNRKVDRYGGCPAITAVSNVTAPATSPSSSSSSNKTKAPSAAPAENDKPGMDAIEADPRSEFSDSAATVLVARSGCLTIFLSAAIAMTGALFM
jgi:endonuclease I